MSLKNQRIELDIFMITMDNPDEFLDTASKRYEKYLVVANFWTSNGMLFVNRPEVYISSHSILVEFDKHVWIVEGNTTLQILRAIMLEEPLW